MTPNYKEKGVELYLGDCLEIMKRKGIMKSEEIIFNGIKRGTEYCPKCGNAFEYEARVYPTQILNNLYNYIADEIEKLEKASQPYHLSAYTVNRKIKELLLHI